MTTLDALFDASARAKPGPKPKARKGDEPGTRLCIECKNSLRLEEFYVDKQRPDGLHPICKTCIKQSRRRFYGENAQKVSTAQARYRTKRRKRVLAHYGDRCACCGEDRYEFMAIDHINGGGLAHKRTMGGQGKELAQWLIRNGFPDGFRILCHNCNMAIGFYGRCPHQVRQPADLAINGG